MKTDDSAAILEWDGIEAVGAQRLETPLTAPDDRTRSAFFVTITRLDPPRSHSPSQRRSNRR
ncbi:hypothetical protein [Isosphaera pallida]|uniref:hypothetical protein n=1 Tax=Isosphaera pallida TaxID=128 RepID=UPI0011D1A29E|nr:hypothetical protein [Isosphaera pallida]